jgi:hypothetical protein
MKVKDLLELLKTQNPEMKIVVDGYEGGFDELDSIKHVCITENPDKKKDPKNLWWLGDYEECIFSGTEETAILLPRKN